MKKLALCLLACLALTLPAIAEPTSTCDSTNFAFETKDATGNTFICNGTRWVLATPASLKSGLVDAGFNNLVVLNTLTASASANKGTLLLDGGSPTVTVSSGAVCVCSLVSADAGTVHNTACPVASTTMTAAGNKGDTIAYQCL